MTYDILRLSRAQKWKSFRFWVAKENIRRYEGTADKRLMKKKQTPKWKKAIKIMQDEIKAEQVENNDVTNYLNQIAL